MVDAVRGRLGRSPRYLPVYGRLGRAFFADPALAERFRAVEAQAPSWRNAVAARFLLHAPRYRAGTIERVRCPVLVTLARDHAQVSTPFVERQARRGRDVEIRTYPVGHFDVYHGAVRDEVIRDQRDFLVRHLAGTPQSVGDDGSDRSAPVARQPQTGPATGRDAAAAEPTTPGTD